MTTAAAQVVGKYRKIHLYGDEAALFDTPPAGQERSFTASFGVTFGTCVRARVVPGPEACAE